MDVLQMQQMYEAGSTLKEIAEVNQTSYQTVRRRLVASGLQMRPPHQKGEAQKSASMARSGYDDDQLRSMSVQGMTCEEIGQAIGRNGEAVRRAMVRRGIPRQEGKARPTKNHFWKGGLTVDKHGYILQKSHGHPYATALGYVRQHRLVLERELGRHLLPEEKVDHRNGDTSDNRPENLRAYPRNSDHLRDTLTGKKKLPTAVRAVLTRWAVQRAERRVAAMIAATEIGADPSLLWNDHPPL